MILLRFLSLAAATDGYRYIYPVPDAERVAIETTILFRPEHTEPERFLQIKVRGSKSGAIAGELILASDGATFIFTPDISFAHGERIDVSLAPVPLNTSICFA